MKKSELEAHYQEYLAQNARIASMVLQRQIPAVFTVCETSFPHLAPAMKYWKRFGDSPSEPELLAITVICKYAPALFAHSLLERLHGFLASTRAFARQEATHLRAVELALHQEELARQIWNYVERQPGALERDMLRSLGISRESMTEILGSWEQLGVISRVRAGNSYTLRLQTQMDIEVEGMCPECGVRGKGRKELFFKAAACRRCGTQGFYHIRYINNP